MTNAGQDEFAEFLSEATGNKGGSFLMGARIGGRSAYSWHAERLLERQRSLFATAKLDSRELLGKFGRAFTTSEFVELFKDTDGVSHREDAHQPFAPLWDPLRPLRYLVRPSERGPLDLARADLAQDIAEMVPHHPRWWIRCVLWYRSAAEFAPAFWRSLARLLPPLSLKRFLGFGD